MRFHEIDKFVLSQDGVGGVEEFNIFHKSHAGLEALAHQFDEVQWVKEVNRFHKSSLRLCPTDFMTIIILRNCELHLSNIMNFIILFHYFRVVRGEG